MSLLVEIALAIIEGLLYYLALPVLRFIGKYVLKAITLNKYPPANPTQKQNENLTRAGAIFLFAIIILIFFIRNN